MQKRAKRSVPGEGELELLTVLLQGGEVRFKVKTHDDSEPDAAGEVRPNGNICRLRDDLVSAGNQVFGKSVLAGLKKLGLVDSEWRPTRDARARYGYRADTAPSYRKYVHEERAAA